MIRNHGRKGTTITQTISPATFRHPYTPVSTPPHTNRMSDEDEWEEQFIYLDLEDVPSFEELFAVQPDDFLMWQHRTKSDRGRPKSKPKPKKLTHPQITVQIFNFNSESPILKIGNRLYSGFYEETVGSALFFKKNVDGGNSASMKSIVPELNPPLDPLFGIKPPNSDIRKKKPEYTLIADVKKILRINRRDTEIDNEIRKKYQINRNPDIETGRRFWPKSIKVKDLLERRFVIKRRAPRFNPTGKRPSKLDDSTNNT